MDKIDIFFAGVWIVIVPLLACAAFLPPWPTYEQGVKDTHKEAYEHGLMVKEIGKDDEVIYRWIETHKLGYE
jgi:hypothetical protein